LPPGRFRHLVGVSFQGLFHSAHSGAFHLSLAVLCPLSVAKEYLALRRGRRRFTRSFPCIALLRDAPRARSVVGHGPFTPWGAAFQPLNLTERRPATGGRPSTPASKPCGFGLFRLRSPLLTESNFVFLFLRLLRCFTSPGVAWRLSRGVAPLRAAIAGRYAGGVTPFGYPRFQTRVGRSPWLFAAYRVLLRLLAPRHP
jgi:hypothetical protein